MKIEYLSPAVKRAGREADHSLSLSAEGENKWRYASNPHICRHGRTMTTFAIHPLKIIESKEGEGWWCSERCSMYTPAR